VWPQKLRQSIKQFYKRGRFVVEGLQKKHDFDVVFVFITSHYLSTLVRHFSSQYDFHIYQRSSHPLDMGR